MHISECQQYSTLGLTHIPYGTSPWQAPAKYLKQYRKRDDLKINLSPLRLLTAHTTYHNEPFQDQYVFPARQRQRQPAHLRSVLPLFGAEHVTGSVVCIAAMLPCEVARHLSFTEKPHWFSDLLRAHQIGCVLCASLPSDGLTGNFLNTPAGTLPSSHRPESDGTVRHAGGGLWFGGSFGACFSRTHCRGDLLATVWTQAPQFQGSHTLCQGDRVACPDCRSHTHVHEWFNTRSICEDGCCFGS